jgi:HPt (histidine-containing phosphotransfer) domain-containing protein/PAS domain-containing protein
MKPVERGHMSDLVEQLRKHAATAVFLALLIAFIATVLLPAYQLADQLTAKTEALRLVSEKRGQPDAMTRALTSVRDRLVAGSYVGQPIRDLAGPVSDFDRTLDQLRQTAAGSYSELGKAGEIWAQYKSRLEPVVGFEGIPYRDSDKAGTELNAAGRELLDQSRDALTFGRTNTQLLNEAMTAIGTGLEREVMDDATTLRRLMIAGVLFAGLLVALLVYVQWLKAREERLAREAREQTRDILSTVKEGLFLIDADFRIANAHSDALATLLRRDHFEGLYFEDLLRGLVSEQTLETATKYVNLLWGERVNENLIKGINPLAEVEVCFDQGAAGRDARYLEFSFHRVKRDGGVRQVLVSVNDVTSRVMLARELRESQSNAGAQMDMLLGLLQVDPRQLESFLADSDAALRLVNTVLKVPARTDAEFRKKLEELFREMHKLKGEAAALGVATIETRAHEFEDMLAELRERPELGGNDFLPLVVRLDDLFAQLTSIRELIARLDNLRADALLSASAPAPQAEPAPLPARRAGSDWTQTFDTLAQRIAADHGKQVRLTTAGLENVPAEYRKAVQEVVIQFVRNALVHGIEDAASRLVLGKDEVGSVRVEFARRDQTFELLFQDDGAGIPAARVKETAVRRGLVTLDQAEALDSREALGLIFRSGFSTHEGDDRDAGRGVGLDVVWKTVHSVGGRIAIATSEGKFTRFRVMLPVPGEQQGAVA